MTKAASPDLFKQTLRTVGVLVAACVIFVGTLSIAVVAMTSRLFPASQNAELSQPEPSAKKPLSI